MEINLNPKINALGAHGQPPLRSRKAEEPMEGPSFNRSDTLWRSLHATPELRSSVHYPPPEMIQGISTLLAIHMESDEA
jgi:hypothetical protein